MKVFSLHSFTTAEHPIANFHQWLSAWSQYEKVLVNFNYSLYNALSTYRDTIHKASHKFHWSSVYTYDQCFRALLAGTHSFEFGSVDKDLYVTILDSSALNTAVPRCYRCKAYDHKVAMCPFPEAPAKAQATAVSKRKAKKRPNPFPKALQPGNALATKYTSRESPASRSSTARQAGSALTTCHRPRSAANSIQWPEPGGTSAPPGHTACAQTEPNSIPAGFGYTSR